MPDFLALDWESRQLCGLDAQVSKGAVRVRRCFVLSWPEELDPAEQPQPAGRWLQDELRRLGVTADRVLVSLPREDVVVRKLDLPNAPDEELPDLVRLQAATTSSSSIDRLLLDFLPLPTPADGSRPVLLATIPKSLATRMQATLEAAGLELASIGMNPAGTAELVVRAERRREDDPQQTSLVVARHGHRVEISILRDERLVFTHSTELSGESEQQDHQLILAEVSRSFVSLERVLSGNRIARAWVIGEQEDAGLFEALRERLNCEVRTLDLLHDGGVEFAGEDVPGDRALYAGPVGMLLASSGGVVEGVDFLNPRKPPVKTDRRRQQLIAGAAGAALLLLVGFIGLKVHAGRLDGRIEALRQDEKKLDAALQEGAPVLESAGLLAGWERENIVWLEQMQRLNELLQPDEGMPLTQRLYFSDYHFGPSSGDAVARIEARGYARSRRDVDDFQDRLVRQQYRVHPRPIVPSQKDSEYPYHFQLDAQVVPPAEPTTN